MQCDEIKDKTKQTCQARYGCDCSLQNEEIKEKVKQTNLKKYGAENPFASEEIKEKIKQTNTEKYGVEYASQSEEIKEKTKQTNIERYGVECALQSEEVQRKIQQTLRLNGKNTLCSKQQFYLANLLNGELNIPLIGYYADIVLENEKIDLEYDGGAHRAICNFYHKITSEEFDLKEKIREEKIHKKGYKTIRIISEKDKLPSDEVILNLIEGFKNSDFKVVRINVDKGTIDRDYCEKWYCDFGELRNITQKDLEPFEKQEDDTSEN